MTRDQFNRKKIEKIEKDERLRDDLLKRIVQDRRNIISRSVNWRMKVSKIEQDSIREVKCKPKPGLRMWRLTGKFNTKRSINIQTKQHTVLDTYSRCKTQGNSL